ncbi:MAG: hypothetical protein IPM67_15055 [Sphingomonadales bacterium]|mgnify:CR=1 FL=1|jgi:hypothetical protein|nr:hypothetical protein [Sphingomonadales bacterium]MBK9269925.1 hypothetical protein [Sphingomonadales bacterium]
MAKRKTHSFTITVSAPSAFTKAEIRRELRTNIDDHAAYLAGKTDRMGNWIELEERAIKVRKIS